MRVLPDNFEDNGSKIDAKKSCIKSAYDPKKELCFLQRYKIVTRQLFKIDKIVETLSCIRSRWHRNPERAKILFFSKEDALIPVESIKCVVHVVNKNLDIQYLDLDV